MRQIKRYACLDCPSIQFAEHAAPIPARDLVPYDRLKPTLPEVNHRGSQRDELASIRQELRLLKSLHPQKAIRLGEASCQLISPFPVRLERKRQNMLALCTYGGDFLARFARCEIRLPQVI